MGLKPRIIANTQPALVVKPKPPKNPHIQLKPLRAFRSTPLNLKERTQPSGPAISGYRCAATWDVTEDDDKILRFLELEEKLKNTQRLFHGTKANNIDVIAMEGLRPGKSGMFGGGIYMGGTNKAIGYASSSSWRGAGAHYLLEVDAVLGKLRECLQAEKWTYELLQGVGCNSVGGFANQTVSWGGTLRHNEYVVYDPDQVLVRRVHEYQRDCTNLFIMSQPAVQGICEMMVEKQVALTANNRSFKDLVSQQACGKVSYTRLYTKHDKKHNHVDVWLCKDCIDQNKLRSGSKITIKNKGNWGGKPTSTVIIN